MLALIGSVLAGDRVLDLRLDDTALDRYAGRFRSGLPPVLGRWERSL
jgi:hypothetical protein